MPADRRLPSTDDGESVLDAAVSALDFICSHDIVYSTACRPLPKELLSTGESAIFKTMRGERRIREWLTGRAALKDLLVRLNRSDDTSLLAFPNREISLTHSGNLAVAVAVKGARAQGVGVDLELKRAVDRRSARFFLNASELSWLGELPPRSMETTLLRLWTVKEAIFKADRDNAGALVGYYSLQDPGLWSGVAARTGGGGVPVPVRVRVQPRSDLSPAFQRRGAGCKVGCGTEPQSYSYSDSDFYLDLYSYSYWTVSIAGGFLSLCINTRSNNDDHRE